MARKKEYITTLYKRDDDTLKALGSINTLLSQSLQIIKKVNEDEQWDFCTDDVLARRVNDAERLIKEISDVVFQN